jgi:uncharacterized protein YjbI with pentapeptide repeats
MANRAHLKLLQKNITTWNTWRANNRDIQPDLSDANLKGIELILTDLIGVNLVRVNLENANLGGTAFTGANLAKANLIETNLIGANFVGANLTEAELMASHPFRADFSIACLYKANLTRAELAGTNFYRANLKEACLSRADLYRANFIEADLRGADFSGADLREANFTGADLRNANLSESNLSEANLCRADLTNAYLVETVLVRTILDEATLSNCHIHGISTWSVRLKNTIQNNLIITSYDEPEITIDNLKVAQFVYQLLNNEEIRDVIDTTAKKAILILGRFTPERKAILNVLKEALRQEGYLPILFDFPKANTQNLTGTVRTLANISRFIIIDLTAPSCSPYEISLVAPCMKPIKPLFQPSKSAKYEFAMFQDIREQFSWVLPVFRYKDLNGLLTSLSEKVIKPAEQKVRQLEKKRK